MRTLLEVGVAGFVAGGAVVWIWKAKVMADVQKAIATVGYGVTKVGGKLTAVRK